MGDGCPDNIREAKYMNPVPYQPGSRKTSAICTALA